MQPLLRSAHRCTLKPLRSAAAAGTATRALSATTRARAAAEGESHYDPPTGWLWGLKPGEKYEKEGWEGIMFWGFGGGLVALCVGYAFKPDTSIQTWALEEARRRLEVEGILKEPESKE
ncbi:hypothetical protein VE03_01004 [Pseudogymnoascus sp. 23342-1-I1]|nr:hypothetical protein VE03_01004 [Pseudogymnoascus sp. 23342-1-I1]